MTTGALIFAYNNEEVDYVAMAAWSAANIKRHLDIPVAVVTNDQTAGKYNVFDQIVFADTKADNYRYFHDYKKDITWYNGNRMDAYTLTPWDQTLVLDADYVVASNSLKTVLASNQDFLAHRLAFDVTGVFDFDAHNYFGDYRMPMWWATVMMFRKSSRAEMIFDTMSMIKQNWNHYRRLYANSRETYRNDHALSIALHVVDGNTVEHPGIPWNLASLMPGYDLKQLDSDHYRVDFTTTDSKRRWIVLKNQDFHAMGKRQLGDIIGNQG
jgi:hypothetical protein